MATGNRDVQRRAWDVAAYERRAAERERAEREAELERGRGRKAKQDSMEHAVACSLPSGQKDGDPFAPTRAWLRRRDHDIDLEAKVGTTEIVGSVQAAGFACKVCDVVCKDSQRYLAHLNSRAHQKILGMSTRVKRSSVEEVKEAFREAVRRRDASVKRNSNAQKSGAPQLGKDTP